MTRYALISLIAAFAAASPVLAQDEPMGRNETATPPPVATAPPDAPAGAPGTADELPVDQPFRAPPEQLFISPAGEPFRAAVGGPYPVAAWFARADTNQDGVLDAKEFVADALVFFDQLDADHDGRVDGFENGDYESKIAPEISGVMRRPGPREPGEGRSGWNPFTRGDAMWGGQSKLQPGKPGKGRPMNRQGAAQYGLLNEPHPVRGGDADLDGKVSRNEATAAALRRFGLLDEDGDGRIALADLPVTPAQAIFDAAPPPERRKP